MVNFKNTWTIFCLICLVSFSAVAMNGNTGSDTSETCEESNWESHQWNLHRRHAGRNHEKIAEPVLFTLIKKRADISEVEKAIDSGAKIDELYNYSTPLIEAVGLDNRPVVQLLHDRGALFEQEAGGNNMTPLKKTVWKQDASLTEFLLGMGAKVDHANAFFKQTSLFEAVTMIRRAKEFHDREKLLAVIIVLRKHGADSTKPDYRGRTPLSEAQEAQDEEVIKLLENIQLS